MSAITFTLELVEGAEFSLLGPADPGAQAVAVIGPQGEGGVALVGAFDSAASASVPSSAGLVQTASWETPDGTAMGLGAARYAYDPDVDESYVTAHPRSAFLSPDGRGYKIAEPLLDVRMFGARGDGENDDTAAIQAAIDEAQELGANVVITGGTYRITTGLTIGAALTIFSYGARLLYDANDAGAALTIADPAGGLLSRPRILGHLIIEKGTADWSTAGHGIKIQNCYMGEFHLSALKFQRGIWLHSDEAGCVYNDIYVGQLTNNKYSTYLDTASATGWTNQNTFWGGRYSNGIDDAGSHIQIDDSLYQLNGNSWVRPSLEASSQDFLLFDLRGSHNSIMHPRCENNSGPTYYGALGGTKNEIDAFTSPYLTEDRIDITGTFYKLATSVGSRQRFQGNVTFERQGAGTVLSLRHASDNEDYGLEIQNTSGNPLVQIPAVGPWNVYNGKKVVWRTTTAPTTGTWTRGDIAWATNPSAGGPAGWICTVGGSPGTWVEFGRVFNTRPAIADPVPGTEIETIIAILSAMRLTGMIQS